MAEIRAQAFDPYKALRELKLSSELKDKANAVSGGEAVEDDVQDPFAKETAKLSFEDVLSGIIEKEKDKLEGADDGVVPGVQNSAPIGAAAFSNGSTVKVENKVTQSGFSDNGIAHDWGIKN